MRHRRVHMRTPSKMGTIQWRSSLPQHIRAHPERFTDVTTCRLQLWCAVYCYRQFTCVVLTEQRRWTEKIYNGDLNQLPCQRGGYKHHNAVFAPTWEGAVDIAVKCSNGSPNIDGGTMLLLASVAWGGQCAYASPRPCSRFYHFRQWNCHAHFQNNLQEGKMLHWLLWSSRVAGLDGWAPIIIVIARRYLIRTLPRWLPIPRIEGRETLVLVCILVLSVLPNTDAELENNNM